MPRGAKRSDRQRHRLPVRADARRAGEVERRRRDPPHALALAPRHVEPAVVARGRRRRSRSSRSRSTARVSRGRRQTQPSAVWTSRMRGRSRTRRSMRTVPPRSGTSPYASSIRGTSANVRPPVRMRHVLEHERPEHRPAQPPIDTRASSRPLDRLDRTREHERAAGIGAEREQRAHGEQQHEQYQAHREAQQPASHGSERLPQAQVDLPSRRRRAAARAGSRGPRGAGRSASCS